MPRFRSRLLIPALALITLGFLFPALARALPVGDAALSVAERHEAAPGRLFQLWSLLSALWSENGSILEPNGAHAGSTLGSGTAPNASTGDTGAGLEPNG
jgi:hypothetical protein